MEISFPKIFQKPDSLKSEHLEKGTPPVIATMINSYEVLDQDTKNAIQSIKDDGENADWEEFRKKFKDEEERIQARDSAYAPKKIKKVSKTWDK
ncbi:MAG: hypothetical protein WAV46_03940 [Candidatus Moraniibacteriota bacterium]